MYNKKSKVLLKSQLTSWPSIFPRVLVLTVFTHICTVDKHLLISCPRSQISVSFHNTECLMATLLRTSHWLRMKRGVFPKASTHLSALISPCLPAPVRLL